jgi:hypothetical protein
MSNPITMTDAIRQSVLYQLNNVHTSLPGKIISYDFTVQKAVIQPLLNKVWTDNTTTAMPILENVPVIFPRAGGASLTFPVVSGDTCLLVFIERSIDLWLTVGGQVSPDDPRKFDLSDAVAIMGLFPFSETSQATNNTDLLLTYNGSSFRIKQNGDVVIETASKIAIGSSLVELLQTISDTLADIAAITTTVIVPSTPFTGTFPIDNATLFTTLQTQIDSIKGTIP